MLTGLWPFLITYLIEICEGIILLFFKLHTDDIFSTYYLPPTLSCERKNVGLKSSHLEIHGLFLQLLT